MTTFSGPSPDPARINYAIQLQAYANVIPTMRARHRERAQAFEQQLFALKVPVGWIIENFLKPFNAWDEKLAALEGNLIPLEIKRVQEQGGAIGNLADFAPPQPPPFPAIPDVGPTPPPTTSGAIPPGPTSNVEEVPAPKTVPAREDGIIPPTVATGGQPPIGSVIPDLQPGQFLPGVTASSGSGVTPSASSAADATAQRNIALLAVAAIVLFLFLGD